MARQDPTIADTYFFLCSPDWAFILENGETAKTEDAPKYIRAAISEGKHFVVTWSCDNTKKINVGSRAYLVRTSSNPTGILAAGKVIAAPEDEQLRNIDPSQYSNLSAAYVDHEGRTYYVRLEFDSVVDYDFPLEQRNLKNLPQFQGVNFHFQGSGKQFAPFNLQALQTLASKWEEHSLIQQRLGRGRRLVDVFLERGDQAKRDKDYESAIGHYQQALKIDPTYAKALNQLKTCQSILDREKAKAIKPISPVSEPMNGNEPDSSIQPTSLDESTLHDEFTLQDKLAIVRDELESKEFLNLPDTDEARKQILVSIARRQGQTKFRQILLKAYGYKCAITGFDAEEALEAAHIIPYIETENNHPTNGLLLRADLHTLFDLNLLAIHPDTMQVFLYPTLRATEYQPIHEKQMKIPVEANLRPDPKLLKRRLEQCTWMNTV